MDENVSQDSMNTQGRAEKLIVPSPLSKASKDLCDAVNTLDETASAMGKKLTDVLAPELTIGANPANEGPTPPGSAMKENITMSTKKIEDITGYLRRLTARLEV